MKPTDLVSDLETDASTGLSPESARSSASALAGQWQHSSADSGEGGWLAQWKSTEADANELLQIVATAPTAAYAPVSTPDAKEAWAWLKENPRTIRNTVQQVHNSGTNLGPLPHVTDHSAQEAPSGPLPRVLAIGIAATKTLSNAWSQAAFLAFLEEYQKHDPLLLREIWAVPAGLKLAMLEKLIPAGLALMQGRATDADIIAIPALMKSLQALGITNWERLLEPLVAFEPLLQQDDVYRRMDTGTRDRYRNIIASLALRADLNEVEVAAVAMEMARAAAQSGSDESPRLRARKSHVGYYLMAEGLTALQNRVGYHEPQAERLRRFLRAHASDFYISGIWLLTLLLITLLMVPVLHYTDVFIGLVIAFLLTILPASQGAVEIMNHIVSAMFSPEPLPKLDFSEGVPEKETTLVVIPALLLSEKQTRAMVESLEVRYLANRDPNIHYAVLTDLPDSTEKPREQDSHPLVQLAVSLITELEQRYASQGGGSFLFLHRHRVFNAREGVWMGWERKRGKLLDLNRLLRDEYDAFPIKAGNLSVLPKTRYVLTLDADTQLPRDSAHKLIGTTAHPLNRAIVDPARHIVEQGYGILQPRVEISVHSASRSRLARLYSGETGLDIYSRAVSDVYQDLCGDAIFTGKGLYEVDVLHRVLARRFPRNSLLSHDLIEGSYARVGLVGDVEVIDDYPSHLSAWGRRKHRWVRGDWQVAQWLFPRVPDESGHYVPNPISAMSRWKIFDNLRRSLVEPATLLLLLAGWLRLPGGPLYWTVATMLLLMLPVYIQLAASLLRAAVRPVPGAVLDATEGFLAAHAKLALSIAFLPLYTLLSLDAIVRTLFRRFVSGRRMLEWETAAEAEETTSRSTPVELYLGLIPLISLVTASLIALVNPRSLPFALPFLILWAGSRLLARWLNRSPIEQARELTPEHTRFLRDLAFRTWRYFDEFSTAEHHWLIPDNVEEKEMFVAARVSPTNLGLLLNARQSALEMGFITPLRFAELTRNSLDTLDRLEKFRGHIFNWYDTRSLVPLAPRIVSSVDSGNLLASLWTLRAGCLAVLDRPLLSPQLYQGTLEYVALSRNTTRPNPVSAETSNWLTGLTSIALPPERSEESTAFQANSADWATATLEAHRSSVARLLREYLPWLLPEFAALMNAMETPPSLARLSSLSPRASLAYAEDLDLRLQHSWSTFESNTSLLVQNGQLRSLLPAAIKKLQALLDELRDLATLAGRLADAMDFASLYHPARGLLSIAYNIQKDSIEEACYDLLASEARTAVFVSIAKGDIPQTTWFQLGRLHTFVKDTPILVSWTGTMFEYLMPALWMRSFPNSMLARTQNAAVAVQRNYVPKRLPWGISEAGYAALGADGHYQYHAFGIPALAISPNASDGGPVITPYAACLALPFDTIHAYANLERMAKLGWLTSYGFYESADYSASAEATQGPALVKSPAIVRSWMAHHQGMSLLALTNILCDKAVQRWFHSDRRVQATELLLHERPMRTAALEAIRSSSRKTAAVKKNAAA
jgi:cyclic beta-1,2-glucan synthetase